MSGALLHRPILGGVFGSGTYALATVTGVERGLHRTQFLVINPRTGAVVSAASGKTEALEAARRVIRATDTLSRFGARAANDEPEPTQIDMFPEALPPAAAPKAPPRKPSRRRREVFARSEGRCHYCKTALTLEGKWHVEHAIPRALDGTDDPMNLVAACEKCNLTKSDRTALQFVVLQARQGWK